jgi:GAF domain-containing protein
VTPIIPSPWFWIEILTNLFTGIIASALVLLVLGSEARRPLNRGLAVWMAAILVWVAGSLTLRMSLLLGTGNPLFWLEFTTTGFGLIGPTMFLFAVHYTRSERPWHHILARTGLLITLTLLPWVFSHQIVNQVSLGPNDLLRWRLTTLGLFTSLLPFSFQILTLLLFWQNRRQLNETISVVSVAILLLGSLFGIAVRLPVPTISLTIAASVAILGFAVMRRQLFNPLQRLTQELESQVVERTSELQQARNRLERLSEQQRIAADISRQVAQTHGFDPSDQTAAPNEMLEKLVELIHNRLGFHHVYVYLPEEPDQTFSRTGYLRVCAVAGTTARTVMASGHRLRVGGDTLVGYVAAQRRPSIAKDQGTEAIYFTHTALPGARTEIAVPLLAREQLLGVLDVQSIHPDAFSDQDLLVLTILADQLAITIDNVRLLRESFALLKEMEKERQQYLAQAWQTVVRDPANTLAVVYANGWARAASLEDAWSPEIAQAVNSRQAVVIQDAMTVDAGQDQNSPGDEFRTGGRVVALPIRLRGQTIGALKLRRKPGETWHPDEIDTLNDFADRLGLTLETSRLVDETQRYATRERFVREITSQMHETMDLNIILQTAIRHLGRALDAEEVAIRIVPEAKP